LIQYVRASFSHEYTAAQTETVSYGNGRGGGVIVGNRIEFDFLPPAYIQHNSSAVDGLGDTSVAGKVRIASGNALHGNFDVAALLSHSFATGTYKNGAATDAWNALTQMHATTHVWFELENNATFYASGSHDGKMQNFLTPAAFCVVRRKAWKPTHPFLIVDGGMQIATSGFHTYNHNLISEMRVLF